MSMNSCSKKDEAMKRNQGGPGRRNDEGIALLLTLVFIVLLSAIVVEYSYQMRVEASHIESDANSFEAYIAAKSAVATGIGLIAVSLEEAMATGGLMPDSLLDMWAEGVPYKPLDNAAMRCTISDEYGKININSLVRPEGETEARNRQIADMAEPLRALFAYREADEEIVDAIIDWIDADDDQQPNGAESDYYAMLEIPYACKNAPLDSVEELLLIRGMTPEIFFGNPELEELPLTELLTVHGHPDGRLNVNTAAFETLRAQLEAFGNRGDRAESIVDARMEMPFIDREQLRTYLNIPKPKPNAPPEDSVDLMTFFGVKGGVFRIYGDGLAGETTVRIEAYIYRNSELLGIPVDDGPAPPGQQLPPFMPVFPTTPQAFEIIDWRVIK